MEPTREQVVRGLAEEHAAFADLVAALDTDAWRAPTRCRGWAVRDVAAHVTGNAVDSVEGTIGTRSPDEQARAFRDGDPERTAATLRRAAERLHGFLTLLDDAVWDSPSPVPGRTIGNGVLTLWYDAFVHADDIRTALGLPGRTGPGVAASVSWLAGELARLERGPVTLRLDGLPPREVGTGGPEITGDPMRFVLAASGREDPAALGLDERINVHLLR
ncbi:MAG TPA: maleylpyruvate isomerase family mycothiol-dependent enzyme [Thermomonospora sp.]|nr:maleylpyruvate isomerase family mycothiol-dependent enzyme [Thermomonospora sp.]